MYKYKYQNLNTLDSEKELATAKTVTLLFCVA